MEEFAEEVLYRLCRTDIGKNIVGYTRDLGSALMGEPVHRFSVHDQLPVGASKFHLFDEGVQLFHRNVGV